MASARLTTVTRFQRFALSSEISRLEAPDRQTRAWHPDPSLYLHLSYFTTAIYSVAYCRPRHTVIDAVFQSHRTLPPWLRSLCKRQGNYQFGAGRAGRSHVAHRPTPTGHPAISRPSIHSRQYVVLARGCRQHPLYSVILTEPTRPQLLERASAPPQLRRLRPQSAPLRIGLQFMVRHQIVIGVVIMPCTLLML